ncbi:hypothetical protein FLL45_22170 [Aliikangiella marina]|uniref:Lipid A biosynthesis acyltransferase n=1 Tax=Aliikangiella marina TaxID=1712262 RepID=A0A545T1H4_9GAMM|nr:hypothetical protein [Aliikangiella marina]TQV71035.1 hypothetical protein FLL45_22170 [Aliikangiella marina]
MSKPKKKKKQQSGWTITGMIRITHWLPGWFIRSLSRMTAYANFLLDWRTTKVMRKNFQMCYPDLDEAAINVKLKNSIRHNSCLTKEFATAWLGGRSQIANMFDQVEGSALIDNILDEKKPLIMAVPHIGNWEFFWHWLQFNYRIIGMYQPAKYYGVEKLVLDARQRFGGQVFPTDTKGIMNLFRALKQGKIMMILPDQVPRMGAGIYSPLFGHQAYTMTLLHKMLNKTGAEMLFGCCLRNSNQSGFNVHIEAPSFEIRNRNVEDFNADMNRQLESIINRWPNQYQWTYKRFKRQPEGNDPYSFK